MMVAVTKTTMAAPHHNLNTALHIHNTALRPRATTRAAHPHRWDTNNRVHQWATNKARRWDTSSTRSSSTRMTADTRVVPPAAA